FPSALAWRIISSAIRSFLLKPGLKYSSLASNRPDRFNCRTTFFSSTIGVLPMVYATESTSGGGNTSSVIGTQSSRNIGTFKYFLRNGIFQPEIPLLEDIKQSV